VKLQTKAEKK